MNVRISILIKKKKKLNQEEKKNPQALISEVSKVHGIKVEMPEEALFLYMRNSKDGMKR